MNNRFRRWQAAGVFDRLFAALPPRATGLNEVRRVFGDSTVVRVRRGRGRSGGQAAQAVGRRRGGFSTKPPSPAPTSGRRQS